MLFFSSDVNAIMLVARMISHHELASPKSLIAAYTGPEEGRAGNLDSMAATTLITLKVQKRARAQLYTDDRKGFL